VSTRPLSYVGVLDDFALRYADGAIGDVAELNRQLVLATLFSDPLLINDGYLLSHAAIRDALVQPESSPLKHLVECGYVKILSRNDGDLGGLADWMADAGISSAKFLLGDERFRESYLPVLKAWSGQLQLPAYDAFRHWPNIRLDEVYKKVSIDAFERLFESSVDVQEELKAFRTRLDDSRQRRTEWEDIGAGLFDSGQISRPTFISLMKAANESYQYAWGCSLAKEIGSVRVVTRIPQHLANFELSEITVSDAPKSPIRMAIPDAAFALKSVEGKWEKLAGVVTTGNDLNVLKHRFLDALRAYYQTSDADDQNVKRCGEQYTVALSKHFGGTVGVNVVFDLAFVGASTAAGGVFAGPLGMAAGAALSVAGVVASHLGAPKLLWRLSAPSPRKWLVNRDVMARPELVSAFQIDRSVAENYTRGIPQFKP
jgi:hypothetical protein